MSIEFATGRIDGLVCGAHVLKALKKSIAKTIAITIVILFGLSVGRGSFWRISEADASWINGVEFERVRAGSGLAGQSAANFWMEARTDDWRRYRQTSNA